MSKILAYFKTSCFILILLTALHLSLSFSNKAQAQDNLSMNVSLNSDSFFGFYPFFAGTYEGSSVDFTFYGILWSGGTGGAWGNWTEFGVGVGIPAGNFYINPQIGVLGGNLGSGNASSVVGESIVPSLTIQLDSDAMEGELYAGYYLGMDHGSAEAKSNFLHYWLNTGYKISPFISAGLHFEHLRFEAGDEPEGTPPGAERKNFNFYMVAGPYVQFSGKNFFTRFTVCEDFRSDFDVDNGGELSNFYKLSIGYSF